MLFQILHFDCIIKVAVFKRKGSKLNRNKSERAEISSILAQVGHLKTNSTIILVPQIEHQVDLKNHVLVVLLRISAWGALCAHTYKL